MKFTLSQPFAPFLYTTANDGASINLAVLKANAADDARAYLAQNTAGSGPFMLKAGKKVSSWCWCLARTGRVINPTLSASR
ncbi:hypothetical protein KIF59_02875 [Enterobacter cloacae subsp. cloacae]|nr:hypothetical protein [Enterobacter cloacae subsp. cloacae]